MKKTTIFLLTLLLSSFSYGQTATELYNTKDYKVLVKLEKKADKLTAEELYMGGYAFFQLENDLKMPVGLILDGKMEPSTTSNFGGN